VALETSSCQSLTDHCSITKKKPKEAALARTHRHGACLRSCASQHQSRDRGSRRPPALAWRSRSTAAGIDAPSYFPSGPAHYLAQACFASPWPRPGDRAVARFHFTTESVCPLAPRKPASPVCLTHPCQLSVISVLLQFAQDFCRFLCDRSLGVTQDISDQ
jgi:hypothetical protein